MIPPSDDPSGAQLAADIHAGVGPWFAEGRVVGSLGAGGFSGCPVWLVEAEGDRFVLKGLGPPRRRERAEEVHRRMRQARMAGVREVPAVLETIRGETLVEAAGWLWEMVAFVEGQPVVRPLPHQIAAAVTALGRLHVAVGQPNDTGPSFAVISRCEAARRMIARSWPTLLGRRRPGVPGSLEEEVQRRLEVACETASRVERILPVLASTEPIQVRRQWVVRDLWSDHVLFGGPDRGQVVGIIDYHSAGIDTPATDLARLLGSWLEPEAAAPEWWEGALATYAANAPLSASERRLVPFLAASGVVFGLDHWFGWTLEEDREFGSISRVAGRIDRLLEALPIALEMLEVWALDRV